TPEIPSVFGDHAAVFLCRELKLPQIWQSPMAKLERTDHIQAVSAGNLGDLRRKVLVQVEAHLRSSAPGRSRKRILRPGVLRRPALFFAQYVLDLFWKRFGVGEGRTQLPL